MSNQKMTTGEAVFNVLNHTLLVLFGIAMVVPLLAVASTSLSSPHAVNTGRVFIFPVELTIESWKYVLGLKRIWNSMGITAIVTLVGTFLSIILNSLMAYPLSKKEFIPGKYILMGVAVTMIFGAPMIPYFLTVRALGLFDNIMVLIIPSLFGAYYLIIMVTFFRQLPKELEESAVIDGAGYVQILFKIVLPSSKAMLATISLFYAVSYWNQFMHPLLFIQNQHLYPLQLTIRSFIIGDEVVMNVFDVDQNRLYSPDTVKAAVVIFCMLPIVMTYPYLQRYFIKGVMIGSIKG